MKNTALALLLGSSVLLSVPALAQTNGTTAAPAASGTADATAPATPAGGGDFITAQQPDQYLASNIRGANVMSPQNENIGTVSDMVVGKDGKIAAITVDVGGFLGIGAKTVALPVSGLQFVPVSATTSGDVASNGTTAPAGTGGTANGTATAPNDPAVTGSTTTDNSAAGGAMPSSNSATAAASSNNRLDHIMVNFTRDQLQNAPEFND